MQLCVDLNAFFDETLINLNCRSDTRSYLINIYTQNRHIHSDLSKYNLSILYCQAKLNNDFYLHQQIADWIFWAKTIMPTHFGNSNDYYENIGRLSYYSCYKLINRQWPCFEELADRFPTLENQARQLLQSLCISKI